MDLPPAWNDKYLSSLPRRPFTNSICQPQELIADNNSSVLLTEMDLPPENELYLTEMMEDDFFKFGKAVNDMHVRYIEDIVARIFFIVPLFTKKGPWCPFPFWLIQGCHVCITRNGRTSGM